jgi:hypothetical protein
MGGTNEVSAVGKQQLEEARVGDNDYEAFAYSYGTP